MSTFLLFSLLLVRTLNVVNGYQLVYKTVIKFAR